MPENNVINIRGEDVVSPGIPREGVIGTLEWLLERARSGEIDGLAVAYIHQDNCTNYRLDGRITRSLVGAVAVMSTKLLLDDMAND